MEAGWYEKVWQAYAAVGDDKAVGVVGDERKYGNIVMIRVVDSSRCNDCRLDKITTWFIRKNE